MSKKTVGWLITAALLILIGVILFAGAMSMLKFDFRQLSTNHLETNRYDFETGIRNIAVDTRTANRDMCAGHFSQLGGELTHNAGTGNIYIITGLSSGFIYPHLSQE